MQTNPFDNHEFEAYKDESQARWGKTDAYKEYSAKIKNHSNDNRNAFTADLEHIFGEFAICMKRGDPAADTEPQRLVRKLQNHITEHCYTCTEEILWGLGQMYAADERFCANIDKHADGTAAFVRDAIAHFCRK